MFKAAATYLLPESQTEQIHVYEDMWFMPYFIEGSRGGRTIFVYTLKTVQEKWKDSLLLSTEDGKMNDHCCYLLKTVKE